MFCFDWLKWHEQSLKPKNLEMKNRVNHLKLGFRSCIEIHLKEFEDQT